MFCPQCGLRQITNDARFCSGCGFSLNVVSELLANGGQRPWRPSESVAGGLSPRQKGIRQGIMLMLSTLLVVPVIGILFVGLMGMPGEIAGLAAVLCAVGGFLRLLYALFLEDRNPPQLTNSPQPAYMPPPVIPNYLGTPARGTTLPPQQSTPVPNYVRPQRFDTGELPQPPKSSVTDHTTRLLDKQPDEPPRQ
jgi:hypothetical protein